jgi:hypothetical protein
MEQKEVKKEWKQKPMRNTGMPNLSNGSYSEVVKGLQERLDMLPLDKVNKMEFKTMLDGMKTTSWAFDFDRLIKLHLIESIQDTDRKLMTYLADLQNTQIRLAKVEKDVAFHNSVLIGLKEKYMEETDELEKKRIYTEIQEAEKSIALFETRIANYIELRNKIRKEIDKGQYQSKALKLKEEQMHSGGKMIDIDFEVLE